MATSWICTLVMILISCNRASYSIETRSRSLESQPWTRHTITAGSSSLRGADGVDLIGKDVATAWEESGTVTVAHLDTGITDIIATGLAGVEDARLGDIDGDGLMDVTSASDSGKRVYISFGGGPTIDVLASHDHNRAMQIAIADIDNDGHIDIVFGTRAGSISNPAIIAWLHNPGSSVRDGSAWTYHQISLAGWTMSIVALDIDNDGDLDIVVSDRSSYKDSLGVIHWDLYGARWEEQTSTGWINHPISTPAGNCMTCTPGDEMFLRVIDIDNDGDLDILDGTSSATHPNRIVVRRNSGTWTQEIIPAVSGVGHYQGLDVGDIDGDGILDLAISTWEVNALPSSSLIGVYWLRGTSSGYVYGGDISGPDGSKYDNIILFDVDGDGDLDVIDSEQVDNQGVIWFENPLGWRLSK